MALAVCSLASCSEIFGRRVSDLLRSPKPYCSRACFFCASRTGPTMTHVRCRGCSATFERMLSEVNRREHAYCSIACYRRNTSFQALGRRGGTAPHPILPLEVRKSRARAGGLARGRNLSKARLQEIAALGVAARTKDSALRSRFGRRAGATVVLGVRLGLRLGKR